MARGLQHDPLPLTADARGTAALARHPCYRSARALVPVPAEAVVASAIANSRQSLGLGFLTLGGSMQLPASERLVMPNLRGWGRGDADGRCPNNASVLASGGGTSAAVALAAVAAVAGARQRLGPIASLRAPLRRGGQWLLQRRVRGGETECLRHPVARRRRAARPKDADVFIGPAAGHKHSCTIVYLHAFARTASEDYLDDEYCYPWLGGGDRAPGLRAVLPTARRVKQPWGLCEPSWYGYATRHQNRVGNQDTLAATRRRLKELVLTEVELIGDARRVFLGGLSQGCTVALDTYMSLAPKLGLGGFVGSVGFMPRDTDGFVGATQAAEDLIANEEQSKRPIWLQCARDDNSEVPWRWLVRPSLRNTEGRLPGLCVREVTGRGHYVDDWEVHMLNDYLRMYASDAYN